MKAKEKLEITLAVRKMAGYKFKPGDYVICINDRDGDCEKGKISKIISNKKLYRENSILFWLEDETGVSKNGLCQCKENYALYIKEDEEK